jgi:hypothetical protein
MPERLARSLDVRVTLPAALDLADVMKAVFRYKILDDRVPHKYLSRRRLPV